MTQQVALGEAPKLFETQKAETKMPQCQKHRLYYPFGRQCFHCLVENAEAEDMGRNL